jgi:MFS transporter, BCD family, chlorophyll transporter
MSINIAQLQSRLSSRWMSVSPRFLPFADVATVELPLARLLRLSMFQVSVGMATALLIGTLNRVLIVEMGVSAWLVALMVALPLVVAPFRALIGFRSDTHRSVLGWKRVPYLWIGTFMQFGGLAIMPFALLLLADAGAGSAGGAKGAIPLWVGHIGAAVSFLLVGAGLQVTQTTGLALAMDLSTAEKRPRVVALMYVMFLLGMVASGLIFGILLSNFSPTRLIQVVQGAALITVFFNINAVWKQEARDSTRGARAKEPRADFRSAWKSFTAAGPVHRFLLTVGLGTAAFAMQDIILEPYGGEILHLSVADTTVLTAVMASGSLAAFALAARLLSQGFDAMRLAAYGTLVGLAAFCAVIFAEPLNSPMLFRAGGALIGFGSGLFSVGTLTAAMNLENRGFSGLALGAWGAVQASASGLAIALGGAIRDGVTTLSTNGYLGEVLNTPATGYSFVYHIELILLFATLIAAGPLVKAVRTAGAHAESVEKFGLAEFPA